MFKNTSILLAALTLITFTVPAAIAASTKCKVTGIEDTMITLDCGKGASKLKTGDVVKVKTTKKKAIEGC